MLVTSYISRVVITGGTHVVYSNNAVRFQRIVSYLFEIMTNVSYR